MERISTTKNGSRAAVRAALSLALLSAAGSLWLSGAFVPSDPSSMSASAVGVSAAVSPNEWNTLAEGLAEQERSLAERERELSLREEAARASVASATGTYILAGLATVLLILILMNFYADWRRSRGTQ